MVTAVGNEFQVNSTVINNQYDPEIVRLDANRLVFVWVDNNPSNGDLNTVRGRLYNSATSTFGPEFRVSNSSNNNDKDPSVVVNGSGVTVVYEQRSANGINGTIVKKDITFSADGTATVPSASTAIDTTSATLQGQPQASVLADGRLVVTWSDDSRTLSDASFAGIHAIVAGGAEFVVNTSTALPQEQPDVATLAGGGFVVVWTNRTKSGGPPNTDVRFKVYSPAGVPGSEIVVNATSPTGQYNPNVTALSDGKFVVAYEDGDASDLGVYGRIFSANGTAQGSAFQFNSTSDGRQNLVTMTALDDGKFVAVWQDDHKYTGGDQSFNHVRGQVFNSDGSRDGAEFQANTSTLGNQLEGRAVNVGNKQFYIVWSDESGSYENNSDYYDLKTRLFSYADTTAPVIQSASVNATSLALTFNEDLDATNKPAATAFAVSANGQSIVVNSVSISGAVVTLTLATAVANGQTVAVNYADPDIGTNDVAALQDQAGNDVASIVGYSVTNTTSAPPVTGGGGGGGGGTTPSPSTSPSAGPDSLSGSSEADTIIAGAGSDTINSGDGNDLVLGNEDNDFIEAGAGSNTVYGGMGDDSISAGNDSDLLFGNEGADTINAGDGNNTIVGGQDSTDAADVITAGRGNDLIFANGGADKISAGDGNNIVVAGFGNDTITAGNGDDIIYANQDNDVVNAGDGFNLIFGGMGDDSLTSGSGNDTLYGNEGNDTLMGGAGADRYIFNAGDGNDRVQDFSSAEGDRLNLMGQTYLVSQDASGNAVLTLSGGGTIALAGVATSQVNDSFFI